MRNHVLPPPTGCAFYGKTNVFPTMPVMNMWGGSKEHGRSVTAGGQGSRCMIISMVFSHQMSLSLLGILYPRVSLYGRFGFEEERDRTRYVRWTCVAGRQRRLHVFCQQSPRSKKNMGKISFSACSFFLVFIPPLPPVPPHFILPLPPPSL